MTPKEQIAERVKPVREAYLRHDPLARAFADVVKQHIDSLKEKIVEAENEEVLRLQGAARHLKKLLTDLTVPPPNAGTEE